MNEKNMIMVNSAKNFLKDNNIFFIEFPGGQLQISGANYWSTKSKWHDPSSGVSGMGLNGLLTYLKERGRI